jgi:hypothetical protein
MAFPSVRLPRLVPESPNNQSKEARNRGGGRTDGSELRGRTHSVDATVVGAMVGAAGCLPTRVGEVPDHPRLTWVIHAVSLRPYLTGGGPPTWTTDKNPFLLLGWHAEAGQRATQALHSLRTVRGAWDRGLPMVRGGGAGYF